MNPSPDPTVRHIVVFRLKPTAAPEQVEALTDRFRSLTTAIPGIIAFECGVNNSPEGLNQGFTHVFQLTFTNAQARDSYLPHPAHAQFGEFVGQLGIVEDVFVVDYNPA